MQIMACTEEGAKKGNVHVQAAWVQPFASYADLGKDLATVLRLLCGLRRRRAASNDPTWNVVVVAHDEDPARQPSLAKVTRAGAMGYCSKQRNIAASFRCALVVFVPLARSSVGSPSQYHVPCTYG